MNRIVSSFAAILFVFSIPWKAFGENTPANSETNSLTSGGASGPKISIHPLPVEDEKPRIIRLELEKKVENILPWQDRMDFETVKIRNEEARDLFYWEWRRFYNRNHSFGLYVYSQYPVTVSGPRAATLDIGFSLSFKF